MLRIKEVHIHVSQIVAVNGFRFEEMGFQYTGLSFGFLISDNSHIEAS